VGLDEVPVEDFGLLFEILSHDREGNALGYVVVLDDRPLLTSSLHGERFLAEARERTLVDGERFMVFAQRFCHLAKDVLLGELTLALLRHDSLLLGAYISSARIVQQSSASPFVK